jgi:hypothetical protein
VTIFGGFAPFIATWLVKETGSSIGAVLLRNGGGCDQLHCHRPHAGNRTPPARLNGAAALKRSSRPIR